MKSLVSKVPKRSYSTTLTNQLEELKSDGLMARFADSRRQLSSDRYRPLYHYVNPEGNLNDPNGLCYWQGQYHLFYQAYPPEDPRQHWGHAVSDDLVHWSDLPLAIYPDPEEACYSGSTLVEDDRVIAMYYGRGHGNIVAVSSDPLLLNWEKLPGPGIPMVEPDDDGLPYRVYDPCIWKEDDGYYSLSGSYWKGEFFRDCRMVQHLFFSQDLSRWTYLGPLTEGDVFTGPGEDTAVPYFWPIGDKHILVFGSHQRGAQYLLGDYDKVHHKFRPSDHGRFSFGRMGNGSIHAPSATPDGRGGVYVIYNMNNGRPVEGWDDIMSLPRILTLGEDGELRQTPVPALESLRSGHRSLGETTMPANEEVVLDGIKGNSMELDVEIDPGDAREVSLTVLRSPGGEERTEVKFLRQAYRSTSKDGVRIAQDALAIDATRSSLLSDVQARPPEVAPFLLGDGETLNLRVFIDRSSVEVFANGRQCVALRVYPEREDGVGVSLRAQGSDATLRSLDAWQMASIWDTESP